MLIVFSGLFESCTAEFSAVHIYSRKITKKFPYKPNHGSRYFSLFPFLNIFGYV